MENLEKAIKATQEKNAIDFKNFVHNELSSRIYSAINSKKEHVSKQLNQTDETSEVEVTSPEDSEVAVSEANVIAPSAPTTGAKVGIPGSERSNAGGAEVPNPLEDGLRDEIETAFGVKGDNASKPIAKDDDISLDPNFEKEFFIKEMDVEGHKVTIKQIGLGLSKPVRVYVDGNRWEFFPGPDAAMRAVKPYINSLNQQNNESFEIKETMSMPSMSLTMSNKKMLDAINMKNGKFVMGEEDLDENQEAYRKFFVSSLKKFGASSPSELSGDKRKEFFNYIKKNWKG